MSIHPPAASQPDLLIGDKDFLQAVEQGAISEAQAQLLRGLWAPRAARGPRFGMTNVLFYLGGLIAISAMTLFMTLSWNSLGLFGLLSISLAYMGLFIVGADKLSRSGHAVPAGILATLAIAIAPLVCWCAQNALGFWPEGSDFGHGGISSYHYHIDGRWIVLELSTLATAAVLLWRMRLPFMMMPVAATLWYMSMDLSNLWGASPWSEAARSTSMVFGLGTIALALYIDARRLSAHDGLDFAFWPHLFGVVMFWGALSMSDSHSELGKLAYGAANVAMVLGGAALGRRVYTVFGGLGLLGYLGHLSYALFSDSTLFPFVLMILGLGVAAAGIWWQRHEAAIHAQLSAWLPASLRR